MKFDNLVQIDVKEKILEWEDNPSIGWFLDSDIMKFYYSASSNEVENILSEGIYAEDEFVKLYAEPYTASSFSRIKSKTKDSVIFVIEMPQQYLIRKNYTLVIENDDNEQFSNKELYEKWDKSDVEYYALIEINVPNHIPLKFIKGYIEKNHVENN